MSNDIPNKSTFTKNEVISIVNEALKRQATHLNRTMHDTRNALQFGELTLFEIESDLSYEELKESAIRTVQKTQEAAKILNDGLRFLKNSETEVLNIKNTMDSACDAVQHLPESKIEAINEIQDIQIICCRNFFNSAIINIFNNSAQANNETKIHCSAHKEEKNINIVITDTSGGIAPEQFKKDPDDTQHGFGLKIIQDGIKRCGGTIQFTDIINEEKIIGTKHTISLPLSIVV